MNRFDLTDAEDLHLRFSIMLPGGKRSLYEYFCCLPLNTLQAYPKKGYHWWMGRTARSPRALDMRDYILYWRLTALLFRMRYSRKYLESLSLNELKSFHCIHIQKTPLWAYEAPIRDVQQLLLQSDHTICLRDDVGIVPY